MHSSCKEPGWSLFRHPQNPIFLLRYSLWGLTGLCHFCFQSFPMFLPVQSFDSPSAYIKERKKSLIWRLGCFSKIEKGESWIPHPNSTVLRAGQLIPKYLPMMLIDDPPEKGSVPTWILLVLLKGNKVILVFTETSVDPEVVSSSVRLH